MSLTLSIAHDGTHVVLSTSGEYLFANGHTLEISSTLPSIYSKLDSSPISTVIGTIRLKLGRYLVIADKHNVVGSILGKDIAKITSYKILPLGGVDIVKKSSEEAHYLELLHHHLSLATLYYSVGNRYDLTSSLQDSFSPEYNGYDEEFWWNKHLCEELLAIGGGLNTFVTPIIYGYVESHVTNFRGTLSLDFALVTRRSVLRAGTRYFRRGVDPDGHVANFNETEQIFVSNNDQIFSFLQIRGSVPVAWSEINNLKYRPNLAISSKPSLDSTAKHFASLVEKYGDVYCVNLVNQSGYEKPVKQAFESAVDALPLPLHQRVKYIYFDFHHECRGMRWDRVKLLLDHLVKLGYTSNEYFQYDAAQRKVVSTQSQVIRTNCMDCLDRTNVVQSTVARWVLQNQLESAHYFPASNVTPWEVLDPNFNLFFQGFWADNADAVSCAYSGTGALKTDFTRTGKRTKVGAVNDLVNSITRYYKNNLKDGIRQDGFDLFLGNYKPYELSVNSPFIDRRPPYVQLLPYLMGTSLLVLLAILLYPRWSITDWKNLLVIGGCLFFNIRSLLYINREGYQFVNWPKLENLDFLKKVDVFDREGKLIGIKYEEQDAFKTLSKKSE